MRDFNVLSEMVAWRVLSLCLAVCATLVNGLYFHISETEEKCFIEEVPSETMIVGKSRALDVPVCMCVCVYHLIISIQESIRHSCMTILDRNGCHQAQESACMLR